MNGEQVTLGLLFGLMLGIGLVFALAGQAAGPLTYAAPDASTAAPIPCPWVRWGQVC